MIEFAFNHYDDPSTPHGWELRSVESLNHEGGLIWRTTVYSGSSDSVQGSLTAAERFAKSIGGKIVNFGVQMVSTWQNTQGQILAAAANLNVNIANATQPVVQFVPHLTIVEAAAPAAPVPPAALLSASGNGISNVSGVAQSIQIAGDGNRIGNDASITITNAPPPPLPAPSGGSQSASLTSPTTGATVSAAVQGNGLSVGISVPNIGRTLQQIKGAAANGGGIVQMVQAAADMQWIQNRMNIYVNLQSVGPASASTGLSSALNSLRGLRPMGAF